MRDALLAQNRTILYSLCEWGHGEVWNWGNETGNSWRTTGDITGTTRHPYCGTHVHDSTADPHEQRSSPAS